VALGVGGFLAWPHVKPLLPSAQKVVLDVVKQRPPSEPAPIIINSQPEGARVRINGEDKGQTPLVMDNEFPSGMEVPVEVSLPGYKPWKATLSGSAPAQFDVRLQKR
jgi:hypothetical protein